MKYKRPRHVGYCPLVTHRGAASICRKTWQVKESWPENRTRSFQKCSPKRTGGDRKAAERAKAVMFLILFSTWEMMLFNRRKEADSTGSPCETSWPSPKPLYLAPCPNNLTDSSLLGLGQVLAHTSPLRAASCSPTCAAGKPPAR